MAPKSSRSRFSQVRRRRVVRESSDEQAGTFDQPKAPAGLVEAAWQHAAAFSETYKPAAEIRREFYDMLSWDTDYTRLLQLEATSHLGTVDGLQHFMSEYARTQIRATQRAC